MIQVFLDNPCISHTQTSITARYNVLGATDMDDRMVRSVVLASVPKYVSWPMGSALPWPVRNLDLQEAGPNGNVWKATITWGVLNAQLAFELGGKQEHVRQNLATLATYMLAGEAQANIHQAVGWDGKTVHGVSIYVPSLTWSETVEVPVEGITQDYVRKLEAIAAAPVSLHAFRGREPEEVLFLGASGTISTANPEYMTLTFKFAFEKNRTVAGGDAITIGGIVAIEKFGWEYIDVLYKTEADDAAHAMVPVPKQVTRHMLYRRSDFKDLNIGVGKTIIWGGP